MKARDEYKSLRDLLDQFGRGGSRKDDLAKGKGLVYEQCRYEIAKAVLDAKQGKGKFDGQLLIKAMKLLFPRTYNPTGRLGCTVCTSQDFRRIEYELPRIGAEIEKLGGSSDLNPSDQQSSSSAEQQSKPTVQQQQPAQAQQLTELHVGYPVYVVTGQAGAAGLSVGIVVQLVPQILCRMLDKINSLPVVVDPSRAFATLKEAHDQARSLHTMASSAIAATVNEPKADQGIKQLQEDEAAPAPAPAPDAQQSPANLTNLPKRGDMLDNGDIQCKVTMVKPNMGLIYLQGEIQSITVEQFQNDWAVVSK